MTKVIAFSGVHNTGKTAAIKAAKDLLLKKRKCVMVLEESTPLFIKYLNTDRWMMQSSINKMELCRTKYVQALKEQNIFDYILVDRTPKDNIGYTKYLQQEGKLDPDFLMMDTNECPYDTIIFYTTPVFKMFQKKAKPLKKTLLETLSEYPIKIIQLRNFKEDREKTLKLIK